MHRVSLLVERRELLDHETVVSLEELRGGARGPLLGHGGHGPADVALADHFDYRF